MSKILETIRITPENTELEILSPSEISALFAKSSDTIQFLLERCVLAILNSGEETDDVKTILDKYASFSLKVEKTARGIEIELLNAPINAFVSYQHMINGEPTYTYKIIEGIRQNIFSVLRDLVFIKSEIERTSKFDLNTADGITDAVFLILRNAGIFQKIGHHKIIVCWGGHAISNEEYDYTKNIGYQCGIRFMDIITGCGPGAMKGPMKGAAIAHAKQRNKDGRYIGITEPGIIASEAPNAIVNPLVIMPDIEKRLESFVRLGQGIIIFPGGAGTAEELMYILGILSHPKNKDLPFPIILTGPESSRIYFKHLDQFVKNTLGSEATQKYTIIINDPVAVAHKLNQGLLEVKASRENNEDSYYFNRNLFIPDLFQKPFHPTHENVASLNINKKIEPFLFAATIRQVFSAIVCGNIKPEGISAIEAHGPLKIHGDHSVLQEIDKLILSFIQQHRMRLKGEYHPVYEIV